MKKNVINLMKPLSQANLIQNFTTFIKSFKESNNQYMLLQVTLVIQDKNIETLCEKTNVDVLNKREMRAIRNTIRSNFRRISNNKKIKANSIVIEHVVISESIYKEINAKLALAEISDYIFDHPFP
uniref:hypothetical protein n=1 Tax=Porodaedalea niemelaei TaxID=175858 RepID=UPI0023AAA1BE|nr:hypothetical protein P1R16_mgp19 [Porodaedalea niemelaei]WCF76673.1 hypothetical protein [Porodaedalea niemelaei]